MTGNKQTIRKILNLLDNTHKKSIDPKAPGIIISTSYYLSSLVSKNFSF